MDTCPFGCTRAECCKHFCRIAYPSGPTRNLGGSSDDRRTPAEPGLEHVDASPSRARQELAALGALSGTGVRLRLTEELINLPYEYLYRPDVTDIATGWADRKVGPAMRPRSRHRPPRPSPIPAWSIRTGVRKYWGKTGGIEGDGPGSDHQPGG